VTVGCHLWCGQTLGEFVDVLLQDDFELASLQEPLEQALAAHDPETQVSRLVASPWQGRLCSRREQAWRPL
jgi:hypothetical protein